MRAALLTLAVGFAGAQETSALSENLDIANTGPARSADAREWEPNFSLRPPYVSEDNNNWEIAGATSVKEGFVRITPAETGKAGYVFSRATYPATDWEVLLELSVKDGAVHGGGEGMAFWYVSRKLMGPVMGGADYWDGLGILLDTFDDTRSDRNAGGNNVKISAIYNDGTQAYAASSNGGDQSVGTCYAALRNRLKASFLRITYLNKNLIVEIAMEIRNKIPIFKPCFAVPLDLGVDKFFGVSASTGHAISGSQSREVDNHDLLRFQTFRLASRDDARETERRDSYRRERDTLHDQAKGYRQLNDNEFFSSVLTSLHQMQGLVNNMDNTQMALEKQIKSGSIMDKHKEAFAKREMQESTFDSQGIVDDLSKLRNQQMEIIGSQDGKDGNSDSRDAAQLASDVLQKQEQIIQTLRDISQSLPEGAEDSQGSTGFDMKTTFRERLKKFKDDIFVNYDDVSRRMKELRVSVGNLLVNAIEPAAGGGDSQIFTILVLLALISMSSFTLFKKAKSVNEQAAYNTPKFF